MVLFINRCKVRLPNCTGRDKLWSWLIFVYHRSWATATIPHYGSVSVFDEVLPEGLKTAASQYYLSTFSPVYKKCFFLKLVCCNIVKSGQAFSLYLKIYCFWQILITVKNPERSTLDDSHLKFGGNCSIGRCFHKYLTTHAAVKGILIGYSMKIWDQKCVVFLFCKRMPVQAIQINSATALVKFIFILLYI